MPSFVNWILCFEKQNVKLALFLHLLVIRIISPKVLQKEIVTLQRALAIIVRKESYPFRRFIMNAEYPLSKDG